MKMILILLLTLTTTLANAQSPWYFGSGEAVNLTNGIKYNNGVKNIAGALDPSAVAVSADSGSIYFSTSGTAYLKQDDGLSTNWLPLGLATAGTISALNGQAGPTVTIDTGTTGADFNIAAAANVITLHLPSASATNRGALTSANWTTFNNKEPAITATTSADYYRGDKTFQPLNKAAVGLSNVDNTSDANKPISTATQTALDAKVTGPASSVDGEIVLFDLTTGKLIKSATGSGFVTSTSGVYGTQTDISLVNDVTGVLPMANGGTDKNLTPVLGGVVYTDAGSMEVLAAGTSGQVLTSNGGAAPTWEDLIAGGDVTGPASSIDNCVTTFDSTTGKIIQCNSLVTIDNSSVISGLTQANVDNLRLDGNTLSSTNSNGNILLAPNGTGRVGIGGSPDASALFDVASTTLGFLPPRMTQTQRDGISAVAGLQVFNSSTNRPNYFDGTIWRPMDANDNPNITIEFSGKAAGASLSTNCTSSPCTVYNLVGNASITVTRTATGRYRITHPTVLALNCVCNGNISGNAAFRECVPETSSQTSTTVDFRLVSTAAADADGIMIFHCTGNQ